MRVIYVNFDALLVNFNCNDDISDVKNTDGHLVNRGEGGIKLTKMICEMDE